MHTSSVSPVVSTVVPGLDPLSVNCTGATKEASDTAPSAGTDTASTLSKTNSTENLQQGLPPPPNHNGSSPWCQNCQTSTTPLWRRNEYGQILCNACGLFLKLHGRPRPISLKTDVIKSRNRNKVGNSNGNTNGFEKERSRNKSGASRSRRRQPPRRNNTSHQSNNTTSNSNSEISDKNNIAATTQPVSATSAIESTSTSSQTPQQKVQLNRSGPTKVEADLIDSLAHLKQGDLAYAKHQYHEDSETPVSTTTSLPPIHPMDANVKRTALPSLRDSPLLSPLISSYPSTNGYQNNHANYQHVNTKLTDSLSSNIHIHSSSMHGSGVLASLRASYHGTPIADSIISNNPLKKITSPLLLATSNTTKGPLPSVVSSLALKNADLPIPTSLSSVPSSVQPQSSITATIPSTQPSALDQLTKAACTSPYLVPIPQSSDSRGLSDKKPLSVPSKLSSLSNISSILSSDNSQSTDSNSQAHHSVPNGPNSRYYSQVPASRPVSSALPSLQNPMSSMMSSNSSKVLYPTENEQDDSGKQIKLTSPNLPETNSNSSEMPFYSGENSRITPPLDTGLVGSKATASPASANNNAIRNNIVLQSPRTSSASKRSSEISNSAPGIPSVATPYMETRISELEFVNDLLLTRVSELEQSQNNLNQNLEVFKQSESLSNLSKTQMQARIVQLETELVASYHQLQSVNEQLADQKAKNEQVKLELEELKGNKVLQNNEETLKSSPSFSLKRNLNEVSHIKEESCTTMFDDFDKKNTNTNKNKKEILPLIKAEPIDSVSNTGSMNSPLKKIKV